MTAGFSLRWDANNTLCDDCQLSNNSRCGYNHASNQFDCYLQGEGEGEGTYTCVCMIEIMHFSTSFHFIFIIPFFWFKIANRFQQSNLIGLALDLITFLVSRPKYRVAKQTAITLIDCKPIFHYL